MFFDCLLCAVKFKTMEHTFEDFRNSCHTVIVENKEEYNRDEIKAMLYGQSAIAHNSVNLIIHSFQKEKKPNMTVLEVHKLMSNMENAILNYLKNPGCVPF